MFAILIPTVLFRQQKFTLIYYAVLLNQTLCTVGLHMFHLLTLDKTPALLTKVFLESGKFDTYVNSEQFFMNFVKIQIK